MDGVHDLGGMQGFGPVEREENEPVFHAAWEVVVLAMQRAGGSRGFFNIDEFRHGIERMAPDHYLRATYYEKWLDGVTRVLLEKGVLDAGELAARQAFFAARPDAPATEALRGPLPARPPARGQWAQDVIRDTGATPRFAPGEAIPTWSPGCGRASRCCSRRASWPPTRSTGSSSATRRTPAPWWGRGRWPAPGPTPAIGACCSTIPALRSRASTWTTRC